MNLLKKEFHDNEAIIWYLGHSGWAVKTRSRMMIFDYVEWMKSPAELSLSGGFVNPDEIEDEKVVVFVSHRHGDHFSRVVLEWKKSVKDIHYVFGWKEEDGGQSIYAQPGLNKVVDGLNIRTITSTDDGVGFLIHVDGLVLFHAGDHAHWGDPVELYTGEIDSLAEHCESVDIAFLPVSTSMGERLESITEGVLYAVRMLKPKVIFPMHCGNKEHLSEAFANDMEGQISDVVICCAMQKGATYLYNDGRVSELIE